MILYRSRSTYCLLIAVCVAMVLIPVVPACAGVDYSTNSGGWKQSLLVSGNYTSVAASMNTSVGPCFAALSTGGVDYAYVDTSTGAYAMAPLLTGTTYVSLTRDLTNGGHLYGARADGGIDWITWSNTWVATPLIGGNYTAVCSDLKPGVGGCYCARADNGIDYIHKGSTWTADPLVRGTTYKDIAEDPVSLGSIYAVRADGGIDWIHYSGGWVATSIMAGNYVSVAANSSPSGGCYAARADAGVDWIHDSGGWTATSLGVEGKYLDIAGDINNTGFIFGAATHESVTIAVAKTRAAGTHVQCTGTVTALLNGPFQIQATDGTAGIRVIPNRGLSVAQKGYSATVLGELRTMASGEKYIEIPQLNSFTQAKAAFLSPVTVANSLVVSKAGLLVQTTGTVTGKSGRDTITLTDGTVPSLKAVDPWRFVGYGISVGNSVTVTGIAGYETIGGSLSPVILLTDRKVN